MDTSQVEALIRGGESLTTEFKSERVEPLSDHEIYEVVVCLANSEGGVLLIGVENDGRVTGARPRHGETTEPLRLQAAIFNHTVPSINTRISLHTITDLPVIAIAVDRYPAICMTRRGTCVRRVLGMHGPECRPFYPHEHLGRLSDLGLLDYSAQPVGEASWDDLDPLEFERLRQTISRRSTADQSLLDLDERRLVQVLQLVEPVGGQLVPNVAGMLLLGREARLRQLIPTHELAFQVLGPMLDVPVNDFFRGPLLNVLEAVENRVAARNEEQEFQAGLFRIPVPKYPPDAFREAVNNAIVHRDYTRLGTIHIQLYPDHLLISNPGGFPDGITAENLLTHPPKPRNPRLADVFKRIGLAERIGRGVDTIYRGQLLYGRPLPDYSRSDREGVRLELYSTQTSLAFAAFVDEQVRQQRPLDRDELIVLSRLSRERRTDAATIGSLTQQGETYARRLLERLIERGLIEARPEGRRRTYHLSAVLYQRLGTPADYVRTRGFVPIHQEAMVLDYVEAHGRITRREVADLCNIGSAQAKYLLGRLVRHGKLRQQGSRRTTYYERP